MKISICINVDTRDGFLNMETSAGQMFDGCKSSDFLIDGVINKQKFFEGFDTETIVFIDEHSPIPHEILNRLRGIADTVVIRKHTSEPNFNDYNYYAAIFLGRGDIIAHFDQDTAAFTPNKESIDYLISCLDNHKFVSYPSRFSPKETIDPTYNYMWCSTRFFMCKKETIDYTEVLKTQRDYEHFINKYGPSKVNHWAEHILSLVHGNSVFYPPFDLNKYAVFCWKNYKTGTLKTLNNLPYDQVKQFILSHHNIHYPCELAI